MNFEDFAVQIELLMEGNLIAKKEASMLTIWLDYGIFSASAMKN